MDQNFSSASATISISNTMDDRPPLSAWRRRLLSVFAEYRFTDFGRIRDNGAAFGLPTGVFFNESRRIQQNQVQVGFSYKFDLLGPVPVVAKY